jgi:CheY-like chemotaxis protein
MDIARLHIIVVDDLVDAADSTVELLSIWGYDAIACYSGAAGIECSRNRRPDGVLLDLAMPGMDGFHFAGLFQKLPGCDSVPLVALSGYSSHSYRTRAQAVGICHYVLKPADLTCLKDLLAHEIVATAAPLSPYVHTVSRVTVELPRVKRRILRGVSPQLCSACMTDLPQEKCTWS